MDANEYKRIQDSLETVDDIDIVCKKQNLSKDLLLVILTQKIVRDTKRKYYSVKNKSRNLVADWKNGKSFYDISKEVRFPPVLTASLMMQYMGVSKKRFKTHMQDPSTVSDPRIKKELKHAIAKELVYSPDATRLQWERGKEVELKVKNWLSSMKIRFKTEKDLRSTHEKTPDFLLEAPVKTKDRWVKWIECKASFGDMTEVRRDYQKQLIHYSRMFGEGIVLYWYGFLDESVKELNDKILIFDKGLLKRDLI